MRQKAKETLEAAIDYPEEEQQQYQEQIQNQLDEFDNQLDELRAQAANTKEEAKVKLNNQIKTLEQKRKAAAQKLENLTSSRDKAWTKFKGGIDQAMTDLQQSYERALAEFENSVRSSQSEKDQEP